MSKRFAFLLMFSLISSCIELEISAPSFPDIMYALGINETLVELTITFNLIGFCIASLIYGPLSEYHGRRKIMLIGNAILAVSAIGCVLAPSISWLLVSRLFQGFGAATSAVVVIAIIADVYTIDKAAKLYGFMNGFFTTLMALAPITGGFISATIGWRGNYTVVAVICIISWLALYKFLPETHKNIIEKTTDVNQNNLSNVKSSLIITIISDYKLILTNPIFLIAATIPSLLYGSYIAFVAIAPFIYMTEFKLGILAYTLHQGTILTAFALVSIFSGKITDYLGIFKAILLSLGLVSLASLLMLLSGSANTFTISNILLCFGSALLYPIIFARSIEIFPEIRGTVSSAIMSIRYFLCSCITGISSCLYNGRPFTLAIIIFGVIGIVILLSVVLLKKMDWLQDGKICISNTERKELFF